ncbi:MAG TPA: RNHCP domain-containing protein [Treponemataceae bacterium]|nr:RNHCP domain-containing protein [Treponemataceae bacterium]HQL06062.1 RNHCP domain-containing protein [Treponemataceae bacterium]
MSRQQKIHISTESFICVNCGRTVIPLDSGGKNRNHCPHCLHSSHEDVTPGDRRSCCKALMKPIGIWVKEDGEWCIIHRCERCGILRTNRIACDDNEGSLLKLALAPVSALPFPLEVLSCKAI